LGVNVTALPRGIRGTANFRSKVDGVEDLIRAYIGPDDLGPLRNIDPNSSREILWRADDRIEAERDEL
jgi:hypothetical protein